jgi:hypothetical protein
VALERVSVEQKSFYFTWNRFWIRNGVTEDLRPVVVVVIVVKRCFSVANAEAK